MSFSVPSSRALLIPALAASLLLTSCAAPAEKPAGANHETTQTATPNESGPLQVHDAWIKAADKGMTSAFANLKNTSSEPITLSGATSELAKTVEIHEMVGAAGGMSMQELEGGLTLEAGESAALEPGGVHLMLMGLHEAVKPGQAPVITLKLADGTTMQVPFEVKSFTGANESYAPDAEHKMDH